MKATINGIDISYRDQGSGVAVILIHAFPLNQTMWDEQLFALSGHCRVITLDLRGFGGSGAPPGPYSVDDMASDVRGLMSALGIDKAVLVGLSMGGYVSLAFYRNYPGAVRAMVLADTRASADTHEARERRLRSAEKVERLGSAAIAEDVVPMLLGQTTLETQPAIARRIRAMIEANSPRAIATAQRAMAGRRDSTYILPGIDFPVLVMVGSEDKLTSVSEADALRASIRGARLRIIEHAGHLSNLEQPIQFNSALAEFIRAL
jgi:pimeloyl-ACP methyl ester carboxylesterase